MTDLDENKCGYCDAYDPFGHIGSHHADDCFYRKVQNT